MVDLARAGQRLVAVGERGLVMLSDDSGKTWQQAAVPVAVTLTAVQFVDATHGWAVGHAGVVLATSDAGEHWVLQLDGSKAAQIEIEAATAEQGDAAEADAAASRIEAAQRLVADGADKPFLAVNFTDARRGLIVGAFGLAFQTTDGGATWQSLMGQIANPTGMHLYAIAHHGRAWFLAGEQGLLLKSDDGGKSFQPLQSPYSGTFFTLQIRDDGALLAAGLKGHAFISTDAGAHFTDISVHVPVSFTASLVLPDGHVLIANQAGLVFSNGVKTGATLAPFETPLNVPVSNVVQAADGSLVVAGFTGLTRFPRVAQIASE